MSKKITIVALLVAALALSALAGCGSSNTKQPEGPGAEASTAEQTNALKDLREISWEGNELTVAVGTNKSTGCEWKTKFEDDQIIGYSINRKFKLSDDGTLQGQAVGTSYIGYTGKSAGTAKIFMYTDKDWEGNEPGYEYTVTVEVGENGEIINATGE